MEWNSEILKCIVKEAIILKGSLNPLKFFVSFLDLISFFTIAYTFINIYF